MQIGVMWLSLHACLIGQYIFVSAMHLYRRPKYTSTLRAFYIMWIYTDAPAQTELPYNIMHTAIYSNPVTFLYCVGVWNSDKPHTHIIICGTNRTPIRIHLQSFMLLTSQ